jgi:bifunctional DNA-binding transcriptional regulator/antitoxin component of YhaV-PrlF toxin-antitoxin module
VPEARLRPKGQITIPSSILEKANLAEDMTFEVALVNGVITLTPKPKASAREDLMSYAGMLEDAWGDTPQAVERAVKGLRDAWER